MTSRTVRVLPWALLVLFLLLDIAATILRPVLDVESLFVIPFGAFAGVGALIAYRQPRNALGWIYCGVALGAVFGVFSFNYAHRSFVVGPQPLPFATFFAWTSSWAFLPGIGTLITFGLLLFPTGRLPSRRWRPVALASAMFVSVMTLALAFDPGPLEGVSVAGTPPLDNPVGLETVGSFLESVVGVGFATMPVLALLAIASLVVRFRQGGSRERQQIKWFAFASFLLVASFPFDPLLEKFLGNPGVDVFFAFLLTLPPLAVGISILRYRLFDIDVIINRTLVYGALTATLLASYLVIVVTLSRVLDRVTHDSDIAVAASTLAVAALFGPLRRRIQRFIDRRFYRAKYDSARALAHFGARLREEVDIETVRGDVLSVVGTTLHPKHASLWLSRVDVP